MVGIDCASVTDSIVSAVGGISTERTVREIGMIFQVQGTSVAISAVAVEGAVVDFYAKALIDKYSAAIVCVGIFCECATFDSSSTTWTYIYRPAEVFCEGAVIKRDAAAADCIYRTAFVILVCSDYPA